MFRYGEMGHSIRGCHKISPDALAIKEPPVVKNKAPNDPEETHGSRPCCDQCYAQSNVIVKSSGSDEVRV
jgi:hypothetical protein